MKHRIIPVILSGGSGTRLWPASTDAKPKQFHALGGDGTLIAETVERVRGETAGLSFGAPIIICSERHADITAQEMASIGASPSAIVLEPFGRNTAAAGAIAAALVAETEPGALALLLPADHVINDRAGFLATIERAAPFAKDHILTFGISPNRPETGYGYIKRGDALGDGVFKIDSFREKPNAEKAQEYLDDGGYSWNAGMFFFSPEVMLREFEASASIRDGALAALKQGKREGVRITLDPAAFKETPSQPLDIAVMEKTRFGAVAPCDIGWADVGSWDEIWRLSAHDERGNAGHGKVAVLDASGNLLRTDGPRICVAGVDNLIVVATADAVVILPRERAQDVKLLRELALKLT